MAEDRCHSCGAGGLETFYEAQQVPVHSCLMLSTREAALAFPKRNLQLGFCGQCGFIQNTVFDPDVHSYSVDYEETQGCSPRFREFQGELCRQQIEKYRLDGKRILEIGCGKGEFLVELCERAPRATGVGIDPSYRAERTTSEAATRIEFIPDFYSEKYAHLSADYVCCRHTLEHIQPVREFVRTIQENVESRPGTIVFFEVPDVERVLREQAFWDIYYEHCSYFTLGSLARLFRSLGFQVLDLYKGFQDQYLMIEARLDGGRPGLGDEDDLARTSHEVNLFRERIGQKIASLRQDLERAGGQGRRVVIWGSGSKAVSYLTTLGIRDEVGYVVDINPHKHGKFLAGTGHEIVSPEFLREYRPGAVIVMNPVYREEIRSDLDGMGLSPQMMVV